MIARPKRTKPDKNQKQIVEDLRKLGFDVDIICDLPGLYDIVVSGKQSLKGWGGSEEVVVCSVRVEIKSEKGKLNETEQMYYDGLKHKDSYIVARNVEDILGWFGRI